MKIVICGAGYVGLVTGACLADFGFDVVCIEADGARLAQLGLGKIPFHEPGLPDLVTQGQRAGRLRFAAELRDHLNGAAAVFIAVGTPAAQDGSVDLAQVLACAGQIAARAQPGLVIVTKSTVPVGTNARIARLIKDLRPGLDVSVAANPEFLREGAAIKEFMTPNRVVLGVRDQRAEQVLRRIYRPLNLREVPILVTDPESAEMIKYAANAFLATKITFINQIADLCEKMDADVQQVARGIGLDNRIGPLFLHPGPGYGGSCLPKDTSALAAMGRDSGARQVIVEAVIAANEARKQAMAQRVIAACGGNMGGQRIAVLGVTFKPDTDDMRAAPSLTILPALQAAGAQIVACDPQGARSAAPLLPGVVWADDPYAAAQGADALVVLTEWRAFRGLDLIRLRQAMRRAVMIDLRNIYRPAEMAEAGFAHFPVGKPGACGPAT